MPVSTPKIPWYDGIIYCGYCVFGVMLTILKAIGCCLTKGYPDTENIISYCNLPTLFKCNTSVLLHENTQKKSICFN